MRKPWEVMSRQPLNQKRAARYLARLGAARVIQVVRPHVTDERLARIDEVLSRRLVRLTVVVENLHDPHNGAAAVRSAEAMGLQNFYAVEGFEPFSMSKKVGLQCDQWMDFHLHATTEGCYHALRDRGHQIWAAAPGGEVSLEELPDEGSVALVFGNERDGLTDVALEGADGTFSIPMHGFTGSFNLSVSVSLAVYTQAARMRRVLGAPGDLPAARLEELQALWYCLSVRSAGQILDRELSCGSDRE